MISFELDMWAGETKILLGDVIDRLSFSCGVNWRLYEFFGSGVAPGGNSMVAFEQKVRETAEGLQFSVEGIAKFAREITDITDITLVGFCAERRIIEIVGFDSTRWEIDADEDLVDISKLCASYVTKVRTL